MEGDEYMTDINHVKVSTSGVAPEPDQRPKGSSSGGARRSSRGLLAIASLALVASVAVGLLFLWAYSGRNDAETSLADAQRRLDDVAAQLSESEGRLSRTGDELTDTRAQLSQSEELLAETVEQNDELIENLDAKTILLEDATEVRAGVVDFLAASFIVGAGLEPTDSACVADFLVEERGVAAVLTEFTGIAVRETTDAGLLSFGALILQAFEDCDVDPDLLGGAAVGVNYGDNPWLDGLYDDCGAGDGAACDRLYLVSPVGSEYELYGATCGARFEIGEAPLTCPLGV